MSQYSGVMTFCVDTGLVEWQWLHWTFSHPTSHACDVIITTARRMALATSLWLLADIIPQSVVLDLHSSLLTVVQDATSRGTHDVDFCCIFLSSVPTLASPPGKVVLLLRLQLRVSIAPWNYKVQGIKEFWGSLHACCIRRALHDTRMLCKDPKTLLSLNNTYIIEKSTCLAMSF